eukprot:TRINITY_DN14174_c0_g1_i1.p1 TRINITY_DN14174_c0_g1~~TRINITY_DN14174_c0_g1_i1.p1  ORF type:complete len:657 (-),score=127.94 TRINITY_DN14174_c0_g1_i1:186-2156(-)
MAAHTRPDDMLHKLDEVLASQQQSHQTIRFLRDQLQSVLSELDVQRQLSQTKDAEIASLKQTLAELQAQLSRSLPMADRLQPHPPTRAPSPQPTRFGADRAQTGAKSPQPRAPSPQPAKGTVPIPATGDAASSAVIGIDLGTANCCITCWRHDKVEVICNDLGNRLTPSCVAFTDGGCLLGEAALAQSRLNPTNTIFGVMRLVGRKFSDPVISSLIRNQSAKIVNVNDEPHIEVFYMGETRQFSVEQILSRLLSHLRDLAEVHLQQSVQAVVLAVPHSFTRSERAVIRHACELAGLSVQTIVHAQSAVSLQVWLDREQTATPRLSLIVDFGAGECDVSLAQLQQDQVRVVCSVSNRDLGGEDFVSRLVGHFAGEFQRKTGKHVAGNARAMMRLRVACRNTMKQLSGSISAGLEADALLDGQDFFTSITRMRFEELCDDLFDAFVALVRQLLSEARISAHEVAQVVLVGGATRIPKVAALLEQMFQTKQLFRGVNPDEAVASGVSIFNAHRSASIGSRLVSLTSVSDVAPATISFETAQGLLHPLVARNTPLPHANFITLCPAHEAQTELAVHFYEGEGVTARENVYLGEVKLTGLTASSQVRCDFSVDSDGEMRVILTEIATGRSAEQCIEFERRSARDIDAIVSGAKRFAARVIK